MDKDSTKYQVENSPAIKSSTASYSENYILTTSGVLNIYQDLTEFDCNQILNSSRLIQVQFARNFVVSQHTFDLINNEILLSNFVPTMDFRLNGFGAIKNLDCLQHLKNLKSLTVDMFQQNEIDKINRHLNLKKLGIGGDKISINEITKQTELEELFLFEKLKDVEVIGEMKNLKKLTLSKMTLKKLEFLKGLENLKELSFMFGSSTDYSCLPEVGLIEKLSFTMVRKLSQEDLKPINDMSFLKQLILKAQPNIHDLTWLTKKGVKVETLNCINFKE